MAIMKCQASKILKTKRGHIYDEELSPVEEIEQFE
jgi:hypothetical protein